jgi:hypothetical protein
MALIFWALAHDDVCIYYRRRLVETLMKSLMYQSSRADVM